MSYVLGRAEPEMQNTLKKRQQIRGNVATYCCLNARQQDVFEFLCKYPKSKLSAGGPNKRSHIMITAEAVTLKED